MTKQVIISCLNSAPVSLLCHNLNEIGQTLVCLLLFSTVTVLCLAIVFSHQLIAYTGKNEGFVFKIYCIAKDSFTAVLHH